MKTTTYEYRGVTVFSHLVTYTAEQVQNLGAERWWPSVSRVVEGSKELSVVLIPTWRYNADGVAMVLRAIGEAVAPKPEWLDRESKCALDAVLETVDVLGNCNQNHERDTISVPRKTLPKEAHLYIFVRPDHEVGMLVAENSQWTKASLMNFSRQNPARCLRTKLRIPMGFK